MDEHKPLRCPQCGTDLAFIEYGTKEGKNGKPAKWPIYKKCVNPECKTGRKNSGIPEPEVLPEYVPLPDTVLEDLGMIMQLPRPLKNYDMVYFSFTAKLRARQTAMKSSGEEGELRIHMHVEDLEILRNIHPELVFVNNENGGYSFLHPTDEEKPDVMVYPRNIKVTKKYGYFVVDLIKKETVNA